MIKQLDFKKHILCCPSYLRFSLTSEMFTYALCGRYLSEKVMVRPELVREDKEPEFCKQCVSIFKGISIKNPPKRLSSYLDTQIYRVVAEEAQSGSRQSFFNTDSPQFSQEYSQYIQLGSLSSVEKFKYLMSSDKKWEKICSFLPHYYIKAFLKELLDSGQLGKVEYIEYHMRLLG